ncbi:MAG: acylase [Gemmatimonadota bacterium]|nr:acylase [Gemmatimonadota bacterium]
MPITKGGPLPETSGDPRGLAIAFGLAIALALTLAGEAASPRAGPADGAAEILWDAWGVPHVYAGGDAALLRGFGWAMAEAHADLMLGLYGEARGRAAEYWGGERLHSDRWIRTVGIPDRAEAWLEAQSPASRRRLDAFVEGVNGWARSHPGAIADSLEPVLPVRATDVLAHLQRVVHFSFVRAPWDAAGRVGPSPFGGSNAWAIGPKRAAGGRAMLLANPHLPWSGPFRFFEAHLSAPGIDAYGAALVGMPFLGIAFNRRLGWSHTVNPVDGADLYALEPAPGGYRWGGEILPFETERDTLLVRTADGSLRAEPLEIRRSVHGPVVAERDGTPYALRVVGLDAPHLFDQYWEMARAGSLEAFEAALARLQMPFFNVVYADADGHVLYVFNGRVPVRPRGGWGFWSGAVPGDDPALLWDEVHPYGDLPRVLDPPSGWVQNANDPPWSSTWPRALDPADFPPYLSRRGVGFRSQRSIGMLVADERIGFEEMIAYKHSTRVELADRLLDELIPAARSTGGPAAERAAAVLERWDREVDADSRGALLFAVFLRSLGDRYDRWREMFARPFDPEAPLSTPDGLAEPHAAARALAEAAASLEEAYGSAEVAWGAVHRLRGDTLDLPANGAPDPLGVFRVTGYGRLEEGRRPAVHGDSYVAAVEFGERVRARGLLAYGNATRPGSRHRYDQLPLYAGKRLRPIWLERSEVEAHLERSERVPASDSLSWDGDMW